MNVAGIRNHLAHWREWELNPIVVKELRQAVRSWAITGMLLLFLTVLLIISLGFLIFQSFNTDSDLQLGAAMFSSFVTILAIASIFFIPLYIGIRVAAERQENNPDLFYVSTLSPARIILGKFLCGAYIAVLFFSACMPFMAFTNLLRGIDLPTVFFILFYLYLIVCAANMIAIFLACIPASRPFKVLFALGGFFASFWVVIPLIAYSFDFMHSGIGAMMGDRNFWIGTFSAVAIGAAVTGLFFVLSTALISPPSANRALPVRIYITVTWLLGGALGIGWVIKTGDAHVIFSWAYPVYGLMIFSLLAVICNSDHLSHRVRRTIPEASWKRALAFLFYNGPAGGLLWVGLIVLATCFVTTDVLVYFPKLVTPVDSRPWFATTAAYVFDYALTALFIHRKFFPNRPAKITGLFAVLLAAVWALLPSVFLFFLNTLSWKSIEGLELGNVFNVFSMHDDNRVIDHFYFSFGWLVLAILVNMKWFFQQARTFRPAPPNTPPVLG